MVKAFEKVTGKPIPYKIMPRRPGDIDECYADPSLAKEILGFTAEKTLDDMCRDAMNWQTKNPQGYDE
jgi:UDP-glucose 4-epimerase